MHYLSFLSSLAPVRVWEGMGGLGREREPVISFAIGLKLHDVSARKLCDWLVKKSLHFLLPTNSQVVGNKFYQLICSIITNILKYSDNLAWANKS